MREGADETTEPVLAICGKRWESIISAVKIDIAQ
jgi:hypothetical protein